MKAKITLLQRPKVGPPRINLFLTLGLFPAEDELGSDDGPDGGSPPASAVAADPRLLAAFGSTAIRLNFRFRFVLGRTLAATATAGDGEDTLDEKGNGGVDAAADATAASMAPPTPEDRFSLTESDSAAATAAPE